MDTQELTALVDELRATDGENEWIEFKHNFHSPDELGKLLSALSNGAALHGQANAYLVFGIEDETHKVLGTTFVPAKRKGKGNQDLESYLIESLEPRLDFRFYQFSYESQPLVIVEIPAADQPTRFKKIAYIRIGSYNKPLNGYPGKERKIWAKTTSQVFEAEIAKRNVNTNEILLLLDTLSYFKLTKQPYPTTTDLVIERLISEKFVKRVGVKYHITNLGALLFAKDINQFDRLKRKAVRVIVYKGENKIETVREQIGIKGYAVGFEGLINWINDQLPANELIGRVFRGAQRMYPEIAIRELTANILIHQDFRETGAGPLIEIYTDRIVFSNPGKPLITTNRFIDEFQSRNEAVASFMRRIGICEERGGGIDKVISSVEEYQLPAPDFQKSETQTRAIVFSFKELGDMDRKDRVRAVYQHACLCLVSNKKLTNQSLRKRFRIEAKNSAIASRMIKEALDEELIKPDDPTSKSKKHMKYVPYWA